MDSLRTKVASIRDGPDYIILEGKRSARWANSSPKESIAKNTNEEAKDFNDNHSGRFWPHKNQRPREIQPLE